MWFRWEDPPDWWADEIVTLESDWTPRGLQIHLTFLVDPQFDRQRRKGEAVWAVGLSSEWPSDDRDAHAIARLSIGRHWKQRLPEFVAAANAARNATPGGSPPETQVR